MELQTREIKGSEDQRQFSDLLDEAFPIEEGSSYLSDFPVWDENYSDQIFRLGTFDGKKLVASAGLREAELRTPGGPLPVGLVGAVATANEYRGEGIATKLVQELISHAQKKGLTFLALWGGEHSLYQRLGFELCGAQIRLSLKKFELSTKGNISTESGFTRGIFNRLKERSGGLVHGDQDFKWLNAHRAVQWWSTGKKDSPKAYVALGRGIDLMGMIHEWGGEKESLYRLLAFIKSEKPDAEILGSFQLYKDYGFPFEEATHEYLCLGKILDPERIVKSYDPQYPFQAKRGEETWDLKIQDRDFKQVSDREMAKLIFGPDSKLDPLPDLFPLPLWFWGLDAA